ncbi:hypothetical protein E0H26_27855 [Micromonospora zingiberis]|uniref:Uncharacterized protein n=1 Tax=Micromonospora zingiberis TaxID=2053011 RepID=A0A4R0G083_9ACTN|nr:hypothetical protein [Micromonospora zingiberis]TCB89426.1 hypothetical protein E0H26_27855 [Micromonospora zingiberis]
MQLIEMWVIPRFLSTELLEARNRQDAEQALRYAHPLLAAEFLASAERLRALRLKNPAMGGEASVGDGARAPDKSDGIPLSMSTYQRLIEKTDVMHELLRAERNRRRLRHARWAYRLNLPLTKDASTNFAVAQASDRVDRFTSALSTYLPTTTTPSDGHHV